MFYFHLSDYYEKLWTKEDLLCNLPSLEGIDFAYIVSWGKLYKKEVFDTLSFPIGQLHEDVATTYRTYLRAERIIYLNSGLYAYRQHGASIIKNIRAKNYEDTFKGYEERIITLLLAGYDITPYLEDYKYKLRTTVEGLSNNEKLKDTGIAKRLRMLETFGKE